MITSNPDLVIQLNLKEAVCHFFLQPTVAYHVTLSVNVTFFLADCLLRKSDKAELLCFVLGSTDHFWDRKCKQAGNE